MGNLLFSSPESLSLQSELIVYPYSARADPEGGGTGGPDHPWNCQIIDFCHVEIFRQIP